MFDFEFLELDQLDDVDAVEFATYQFVHATDSFLFDPYPEEQELFDLFDR